MRKLPAKIQIEPIECGAISVWILAGFYDIWLEPSEARELVCISKDGSNALDIIKALRSLDFDANGEKLDLSQLLQLKPDLFPLIAWVHKCHWLVIGRIENSKLFISDPAQGHRTVSASDFSDEYSGLIITAKPTPNLHKIGKSPNPLSLVLDIIRPFKTSVYAYVTLGVVSTLPVIFLSSFIGYFTDSMINEVDLSNGYVWLLIFVVGIFTASAFLKKMILRRLYLSLLSALTFKSVKKLISVPLSFFQLRDLGEVSQRITLNLSTSQIVTGPLSEGLVGVVSMLIYAILMIAYNPYLGIIVISLALVNIGVVIQIAKRLVDDSRKTSVLTGRMTSNILHISSSMNLIKSCGLESQLYQTWVDNFSQYQCVNQSMSLTQKINSKTTTFISQLVDYILVITSGVFVLSGSLTLGQFIAFRLIALSFLAPISTLSNINAQFNTAVGDIERLADLWNEKDGETAHLQADLDQTSDLQKSYSSIPILTSLQASELQFRYRKDGPFLLDKIDLCLELGELVSLMGPPGSGKTSLLNCLSRLSHYDGNVSFGEYDLRTLDELYLRANLGYVSQHIHMFNATVLDNIRCFDERISKRQVEFTIDLYGLTALNSALDDGLNTFCLPSSGLSASTEVYIHILRSLVRSPNILILDDVLSSLDLPDQLALIRHIRRHISSVLVVTSNPMIIEYSDKLYTLFDSKLSSRDPASFAEALRQTGNQS